MTIALDQGWLALPAPTRALGELDIDLLRDLGFTLPIRYEYAYHGEPEAVEAVPSTVEALDVLAAAEVVEWGLP